MSSFVARVLVLPVMVLLLTLFTLPRFADAAPEDKTVTAGRVGQAIGRFVAKAHKSAGFNGAVLAGRNGKVVAAVGAGSTGGKDPQPIDTTTLFEIASATKPFTATAVLLLQEQGKLSLDDPISKLLPEMPEDSRAITIRHLLQHTSGIPGTNSQGAGDDLAAVLPTFLAGGPQHTPGTHFEYWNQGYSLLSEIVARASAKTYVEFVKTEIFAPAGMTASCFTGDECPSGVRVATGSSTRGAPRSALDHPYGSYGFQYRGMGGLVTNVWDLWRWDRALHNDELLNAASLKEMATPGEAGYALGWYTGTRPDGKPFLRHGGSVRGFTCDVRRYPDDNACLFVLSATDDQAPMSAVTGGCEQLLFGEKLTVEFPGSLTAEQMASLVGEYHSEPNRRLVIRREGKIARALIYWGGPITYAYIAAGADGNFRFVDPSSSLEMPVEFDDKGKAKTCTILKMRFVREGK